MNNFEVVWNGQAGGPYLLVKPDEVVAREIQSRYQERRRDEQQEGISDAGRIDVLPRISALPMRDWATAKEIGNIAGVQSQSARYALWRLSNLGTVESRQTFGRTMEWRRKV